jgi:hypothetical protein
VPVVLRTGALGEITVMVPADRAEEVRLAAAVAEAVARRQHSANTLRAYRAAWRQYEAWCGRLGFDPFCGDPLVVRMYLAAAAEGRAVKTLRLHLGAIAAAHRLVGVNLDPRPACCTNIVEINQWLKMRVARI